MNLLIDEERIPASRLSATGYGWFSLTEQYGEVALRRNRQIELKLTQR